MGNPELSNRKKRTPTPASQQCGQTTWGYSRARPGAWWRLFRTLHDCTCRPEICGILYFYTVPVLAVHWAIFPRRIVFLMLGGSLLRMAWVTMAEGAVGRQGPWFAEVGIGDKSGDGPLRCLSTC